MKELVLAVVPFDSHARPIAGTYRALIVGAVTPSNALTDLEAFGLGWSHFVLGQSHFHRAFENGNAAPQFYR